MKQLFLVGGYRRRLDGLRPSARNGVGAVLILLRPSAVGELRVYRRRGGFLIGADDIVKNAVCEPEAQRRAAAAGNGGRGQPAALRVVYARVRRVPLLRERYGQRREKAEALRAFESHGDAAVVVFLYIRRHAQIARLSYISAGDRPFIAVLSAFSAYGGYFVFAYQLLEKLFFYDAVLAELNVASEVYGLRVLHAACKQAAYQKNAEQE